MLYTLVLDFSEGTYVSQGHGNTPMEGLFRCIFHLVEIDGLSKEELIEELEGEEPVELEGLESVWCFSACSDKELVLMNLVATIG